MEATLVVAMTPTGGIGFQGALPWHIPSELRHFQRLTVTTREPHKINAVVMGRKTWDSLPIRPLPRRINIVLSSSANPQPHTTARNSTLFTSSLDAALAFLSQRPDIETAFVIGGSKAYAAALQHHAVTTAHISIVHSNPACDTFFPIHQAQKFGWGDLAQSQQSDTNVAHTTDPTTGILITTFERRKSNDNVNGEDSSRHSRE